MPPGKAESIVIVMDHAHADTAAPHETASTPTSTAGIVDRLVEGTGGQDRRTGQAGRQRLGAPLRAAVTAQRSGAELVA